MKIVKMKKSVFVASLVSVGLISGTVAAFASTGIEKITAVLNHDIKFEVDGKAWTPQNPNGGKLSPIVYKGTNYLPARSVAEAVGADIKWDNAAQKITINTGKASATTGGAAVKPVELPATSGIIKLESKEETTKKMREHAVTLIKIYGEALETGNTKKFDEYIDQIAADKYSDSPIRYGRQHFKDKFKKKVDEVVAANTKEKVAEYAKGLKAATLEQVEVSYVGKKDQFRQSFSYKYYPKDWHAFSGVHAYFEFCVTKNGGTNYELSEVYVN
ncbi:stalk domain-containing protein [Paenibacillus sp. 481]|uniref:stalk domain-containing protein n=1 Tax=Paenibacillus sp. 481 TaxID=2835869 RepID=UPI001E628905|nr:stalk domain-containing protein [Paenibacillus sp. 481]UHA73151.1 hypothetical protein KIK04_21560 [Paenibacillus sp. 481]